MTQPSRTTETINRDNAAIRDIMHQIRELTVPDRATLALGLVGHLATMMNRHQMEKLMGELAEEARRVQDVPPSRQRDDAAHGQRDDAAHDARGNNAASEPGSGERVAAAGSGSEREESRGDARNAAERTSDARNAAGRSSDPRTGATPEKDAPSNGRIDRAAHEGVGQAGRGEFRSGRLV